MLIKTARIYTSVLYQYLVSCVACENSLMAMNLNSGYKQMAMAYLSYNL